MSVWRQTGKKPKLLDTPKAPDDLMYLWGYYCQIKRGQDVTWQELKAWSEMAGIRLKGWESEAIMKIESAVKKALSYDNNGQSNTKS
jgi:hypothetical protein